MHAPHAGNLMPIKFHYTSVMFRTLISIGALLSVLGVPEALAHGPSPVGKPAAASSAKRTVAIEMSDAMRFTPNEIIVARGEIVRFAVTNKGTITHELVLGTMADLKEHAEHMKQHPGMVHDEPNMIQLAPGKGGDLVWQFTTRGEFHYGCLVPGHFEAGMIGKVIVKLHPTRRNTSIPSAG
jgi:uncharacterized cupredoxin-like copper-binding protein